MDEIKNLFDTDMVESINNLIEEKMKILNQVEDFQKKDKMLSTEMEKLENELPEALKDKFDNIMRLTYQVEEYYFTLAYLLGLKHGGQIEKLL